MSIVYIGSACIDEHGNAHGGAAGNQSGRELRTQAWYKHEKGWVVIRANDVAARSKIADGMRRAVANKLIGYDQYQRDTLLNASKLLGYDPARVAVKCETDCSALVRVCCNFADIPVGNFRTYNEPATLKATGKFDVITDRSYTDHPDKLMAGDILCTPVSGHTVVVLNDGCQAHEPVTPPVVPAGTYIVQSGDSWIKIAKKFGFKTYHDLVALNGGVQFGLIAGKVLRIK